VSVKPDALGRPTKCRYAACGTLNPLQRPTSFQSSPLEILTLAYLASFSNRFCRAAYLVIQARKSNKGHRVLLRVSLFAHPVREAEEIGDV